MYNENSILIKNFDIKGNRTIVYKGVEHESRENWALIKDLRKKNHFYTSPILPNAMVLLIKLLVNGKQKNIPDIALLKQISNDFGVNIEKLLEGKMTESKNKRNYLLVIGFLFILVIIFIILLSIYAFV
jgi:transcriptional regulator with XRE-family HTH domain